VEAIGTGSSYPPSLSLSASSALAIPLLEAVPFLDAGAPDFFPVGP